MSSFTRRIQRQTCPSKAVHFHLDADGSPPRDAKGRIKPPHSNPPRKVFYEGRGSKLGVTNPKDRALLARLRREKRNAERKAKA